MKKIGKKLILVLAAIVLLTLSALVWAFPEESLLTGDEEAAIGMDLLMDDEEKTNVGTAIQDEQVTVDKQEFSTDKEAFLWLTKKK